MGLVPTGPTGITQPSDMLDQTGDYSFANINVGRAVSAVTAEQQRAVESASGTTLEVSSLRHACSCAVFCNSHLVYMHVVSQSGGHFVWNLW